MANNKFRGFSLAELLISLLIISIVLAAAIPTMTRKGKGSEQIWRWSMPRNSTYFGTGANQAVIIGSATPPLQQGGKDSNGNLITDDNEISRFFNDSQVQANSSTHFTTMGDKLILVKTSFPSETSNHSSSLINSHISFYNVVGDLASTQNDISYAGRLAMDKHNIALGIGSLQSLNATTTNASGFMGNNIAIGHFSLFNDVSGIRNIAIGEKALALNLNGNDNVALGFMALTNLNTLSESAEKEHSQRNTALGSYALIANTGGNDNTAVGTNALMTTDTGYGNTAIGSSACNYLNGSYNICIGANAGAGVERKNNLSEMISAAKKVDNQLIIGYDEQSRVTAGIVAAKDEHRFSDPLLYGITAYHKENVATSTIKHDKQLNVNARYFRINAYDNERALPVNIAAANYVDKNIFTAKADYVNSAEPYDYNSSGRLLTGEFDFVLLNDTAEKKVDTRLLLKRSGNDVGVYTCTNFNDSEGKCTSDPKSLVLNDNFRISYEKQVNANSVINLRTLTSSESQSVDLRLKVAPNKDSKYSEIYLTDTGFYMNLKSPKGTHPIIEAGYNGTTVGTSFYSAYMDFHDIGVKEPSVSIKPSIGDIRLKALENQQMGGDNTVGGALKFLYSEIQNINPYSDVRLKNVSGNSTAGLKEINALEVKNFTYKDDKEKTPHVGVIAQQLKNVFPNSVIKDKKGYYRIKTEEIFYAMVNSIKELCTQIQTLTAKVAGLDKRITELEKQNQELKKQNSEFEKRLQKLEKSVK